MCTKRWSLRYRRDEFASVFRPTTRALITILGQEGRKTSRFGKRRPEERESSGKTPKQWKMGWRVNRWREENIAGTDASFKPTTLPTSYNFFHWLTQIAFATERLFYSLSYSPTTLWIADSKCPKGYCYYPGLVAIASPPFASFVPRISLGFFFNFTRYLLRWDSPFSLTLDVLSSFSSNLLHYSRILDD